MGLIGDVIGYFADKASKQEERYYNEYQTAEARKWAEDMWNKQNEYNLPVNQRKRLEAAGINPNLAFGSSASAMAGSVGSVPTAPQTNNEGIASRRLERLSVLANLKKINEDVRREKNNNDLFEYLLDDRKKHDHFKMASDLVEYQWNLENKARVLDESLYGQWLGNQLTHARTLLVEKERELKEAQRKHEKIRAEALQQEIDHLKAKYGFEDQYYRRGLNPYETSTIAGALRTGYGILGYSKDEIHDWFNPNWKSKEYWSLDPRKWFKRK